MSERDPKLHGRLLIGAIAGFAGMMAMTVTMSRLQRRRPLHGGSALPGREPADSGNADAALPDEAGLDLAAAGQFACGAAAGSLIAAANPRIGQATGVAAGLAIWVASALTRLPGLAPLRPADAQPRRRNAWMLIAHVSWGLSTAHAMRALLLAREAMLRPEGEDED